MMQTHQLLIKPTLDNKPYRLRCRFKIEPFPALSRLDREKVHVAERFVRDMHKQGWEYDGRFGFALTGPWCSVEPVTIHRPRRRSAREMLPLILQGARFVDEGGTTAKNVLKLAECEWWEYELAGVFVRQQILVEYADPGEESW